MKVTILGCGASEGTPLLIGSWGKCDPTNPRNIRTRASIAVEKGDTTLIVDTSPDLRTQWLREGLGLPTAVFYTHDHADHTHGINDLRPFTYRLKKPVPIYSNKETLDSIKRRFHYAFPSEGERPDIYKAFLSAHELSGPVQIGSIKVTPFDQDHGYMTSIGYRFDNVAYSTDVVRLDERAFGALEGVDVWIVDCVDREPKQSHSHLENTLKWIERVQPKQAYLTHMNFNMDYDTLVKELPKGVEPAYDGLVINL